MDKWKGKNKWKGQRSSCSAAKLPISTIFLSTFCDVIMMMLMLLMISTFLLQYIEGGGCPLARHSRRTLDPLRTVMLPFRGCRLWIFGGTGKIMMEILEVSQYIW